MKRNNPIGRKEQPSPISGKYLGKRQDSLLINKLSLSAPGIHRCMFISSRLNTILTTSNCTIYNCVVTTPNRSSPSNVKTRWPGMTKAPALLRKRLNLRV